MDTTSQDIGETPAGTTLAVKKHKKSKKVKQHSSAHEDQREALDHKETAADVGSDTLTGSHKKKSKKRKSVSNEGDMATVERQSTDVREINVTGEGMGEDGNKVLKKKPKKKTKSNAEEHVAEKEPLGRNGIDVSQGAISETKAEKKKSKEPSNKQEASQDKQTGDQDRSQTREVKSELGSPKKKSKKRKSAAVVQGGGDESLRMEVNTVEPLKPQKPGENSGGDNNDENRSPKKKSKKRKHVNPNEVQQKGTDTIEKMNSVDEVARKVKRKQHQNGAELSTKDADQKTVPSPKKKLKKMKATVAGNQQSEVSKKTLPEKQEEAPKTGIKNRKKKEKMKKQQKGDVAVRVTAEGGNNKSLAIRYLRSWEKSRSPGGGQWRFQKVRQVWLLHHMLESDQVSRDDFAIMLEYLKGLQGKARQLTMEKMESLIQQLDEKMQASDEEDADSLKEMKTKWKRASSVLQTLT